MLLHRRVPRLNDVEVGLVLGRNRRIGQHITTRRDTTFAKVVCASLDSTQVMNFNAACERSAGSPAGTASWNTPEATPGFPLRPAGSNEYPTLPATLESLALDGGRCRRNELGLGGLPGLHRADGLRLADRRSVLRSELG